MGFLCFMMIKELKIHLTNLTSGLTGTKMFPYFESVHIQEMALDLSHFIDLSTVTVKTLKVSINQYNICNRNKKVH